MSRRRTMPSHLFSSISTYMPHSVTPEMMPVKFSPTWSCRNSACLYFTDARSASAALFSICDACSHCFSSSEEHTSELQQLMRTSYAVFCLTKKKLKQPRQTTYSRDC